MKNKSVDGLRGIAAINVVFSHFVAAFFPSLLHNNYPTLFVENSSPSIFFQVVNFPFVSILYNGHFAVLIFFVLSGYVLTFPFYSINNTQMDVLQKRLWGRYLRLNIPVAMAILISYLVYKLGLYSNVNASVISGSTNWLNTFFADGIKELGATREALYGSIIFGKNVLIPPLWTLKIEFIGSIYILLFYISKPKAPIVVPLIMALGLVFALHKDDSIYFFCFFAGSILVRFKDFFEYRILLLIFGLYFGAFQYHSDLFDFLPNFTASNVDIWDKKTFYNAVGAVFLTLSVLQGLGKEILENRLFQFLGKISFSIYLVHFIILCSLSCFIYIQLPQDPMFLVFNFVMYVFACILAAAIFEKFIDRTAIRISHRFSSLLN